MMHLKRLKLAANYVGLYVMGKSQNKRKPHCDQLFWTYLIIVQERNALHHLPRGIWYRRIRHYNTVVK